MSRRSSTPALSAARAAADHSRRATPRGRTGGAEAAMVMSMLRGAMMIVMRQPPAIKSFAHELHLAGGNAGRVDGGLQVVPTDRIVGSVDRWRELRADFTFATWPRLSERHRRIARAMRASATLPPLELYALVAPPDGSGRPGRCEYFVVDGHHRVAMARRLGQHFLDAHVIEYRLTAPPAAA
jgi:hypothetical protein